MKPPSARFEDALEKCAGKFMVGYTDLHGSLDCVADWRDPQELCLDLIDDPDFVQEMLRIANESIAAEEKLQPEILRRIEKW